MDGRLSVFWWRALPDIVKELERSYNVTIRIANDSLNTFRFYGNFVRREQSIQEVLDALASTEKIQYKIEERNITIFNRLPEIYNTMIV